MGYSDVFDGFNMTPRVFYETWGLTHRELHRELRDGRLQLHGKPMPDGTYADCRFYLPSLRAWLARLDEMPIKTRRKVLAAGGVQRLERWRHLQIDLCEIDFEGNQITLPDGTVFRDIVLAPTKPN